MGQLKLFPLFNPSELPEYDDVAIQFLVKKVWSSRHLRVGDSQKTHCNLILIANWHTMGSFERWARDEPDESCAKCVKQQMQLRNKIK